MPKIIEEPREMILAQAKSIVQQEGMDQLTIRRVAAATGISIGTVYNYFPTKRELIVHLMEDYWNTYLYLIDQINSDYENFFEKLPEMYRQLQHFVIAFKEGWLKNMTGKEGDGGLRYRMVFYDKVNKKLEAILLEAHQKGEINLTIATPIAANFIVQNFFMMALMNQFSYDDFEQVVRKLLQ